MDTPRSTLGILACSFVLVASPAQASSKGWSDASDAGVLALTALAIGLPAMKGDSHGAAQAAVAEGAAGLVVAALKQTFPERRPDGSDNNSFPSGHTAVAYAAAASLYERQGPGVGLPAFAAATFVGMARIEAHKHHWYDCAVGAGLGTASGLLLTRHRPVRTAFLVPWGDTHGAGATVALAF